MALGWSSETQDLIEWESVPRTLWGRAMEQIQPGREGELQTAGCPVCTLTIYHYNQTIPGDPLTVHRSISRNQQQVGWCGSIMRKYRGKWMFPLDAKAVDALPPARQVSSVMQVLIRPDSDRTLSRVLISLPHRPPG